MKPKNLSPKRHPKPASFFRPPTLVPLLSYSLPSFSLFAPFLILRFCSCLSPQSTTSPVPLLVVCALFIFLLSCCPLRPSFLLLPFGLFLLHSSLPFTSHTILCSRSRARTRIRTRTAAAARRPVVVALRRRLKLDREAVKQRPSRSGFNFHVAVSRRRIRNSKPAADRVRALRVPVCSRARVRAHAYDQVPWPLWPWRVEIPGPYVSKVHVEKKTC